MAGCGTKFSKIALMVVNINIVLVGLGLLVAGLIFKLANNAFVQKLKVILEDVNLDMVGGIDTYTLIQNMSNYFIAVGFIIFAVGFFGFFGACCESRWMLVVYAILIIILLIGQIAAIALFASYKGVIGDSFSKEATKALKKHYGAGKFVKEFNTIFDLFHCCGMNNCTDIVNNSAPLPMMIQAEVPLQKECCETANCTCFNVDAEIHCCCGVNTCTDLTNTSEILAGECCDTAPCNCSDIGPESNGTGNLPDECCAMAPCTCSASGAYPGCVTILDAMFKLFEASVIAVSVGVLIFQILCVIFAFLLWRSIGKEEPEKDKKQ